jgi:hypothetical protein
MDPLHPLDSIATAYAKCTDGAGDGIILWSYGTTTAMTTSYLTSAINWTKSGITVVGVCAPTYNQRARVANASTSNALANLLNITGNNNTFLNFSLFNGGTTGAGCVYDSGYRNYFGNVHMMGGMGMTTPTVSDYSLYLAGAQECTFDNCTFGSDTFDKTDIAGSEVQLASGVERVRFNNCDFLSYRSAGTTAGMINLVGAGDSITRNVVLDSCTFEMYRDGNVTAEVAVVIGTTPNNGFLLFQNCMRHGFTSWAPVANTRVFSGSQANTATGGITIQSTT